MKETITIEINQEEFYKNWKPEELSRLTDEEKQGIIKWFLNRQLALKRDNFKCQNTLCNHNINSIPFQKRRELVTIHHIIPRKDFKENPQSLIKRLGYECDDLQNLSTLCKFCHVDYENARIEIIIDGISYKLERPSNIDYKKLITDGKQLRRSLKKIGKVGWHGISEEERMHVIYLLMRWLNEGWAEITESYN
mgnify:CR=1 FL=1